MTPVLHKTGCDEDEHYRYAHFADFNEWLDSDEGQAAQLDYGVDALPQPSKALFAGDRNGYDEAFQAFRAACRHEALGESWFQEQLGDEHWFLRNVDHFIQFVELMAAGAVVPFVGAGISASAGFSSWKEHLRHQGKTAHIAAERIEELLAAGAYETVLEKIEAGVAPAIVRDELNRLQMERDILKHEQGQARGTTPPVADIFAKAIQRHDEVIRRLEVLLAQRIPEAREILRRLFGGLVELLPKENGLLETKIAGHSAGYFSLLASTPNLLTDGEINLVAGAGLEPATFGL